MDPDLPDAVRTSWQRFVDLYEPLRPELYRYARHLTKSPWDAEDLAQDALARAFVTIGRMAEPPDEPRAFLFRIASNLFIDRLRSARAIELPASETELHEPQGTREAAVTLVGKLSPQERAAVVLKDVFDLSLEEVAGALGTSVGAVKAALHRGRGKLADDEPPFEHVVPSPAIDAFVDAFNARDLARLTALLLDTATVEVVGVTTEHGPKAAERVLRGMLFGSERLATADIRGGIEAKYMQGVQASPPRIEARAHRGELVLLSWYSHDDGDAVRAVTRVRIADGQLAHLRNYFFTPDCIAEICAELGLPFRSNGHRYWLTGC
jgi:RNA polymerase sigma-70 factor (ECF subfamily)